MTFWVVWVSVLVCFLTLGYGIEHARRSARPRFQPVEYHPVGPVSGFNVGRLTREYIDREDMDSYDFERRLDEFVENSTRIQPLGDVTLIQASAAVMAQSSAGVIPSGMTLAAYAEQLRQAGLSMHRFAGTPIFEMGHNEPVGFIAEPSRCRCGALDSPNHRVMCWQADGSHLPGEPDEAY